MTIYSHTCSDRTPYTYLIGWASLGLYYYGVRYGKGCHPSDLWVTYFTSSHVVAEIRKLWCEPDVIEVRKVFNTVKKAQDWESNVLTRLDVIHRQDVWLNQKNAKGIDSASCSRGARKMFEIAYSQKKGVWARTHEQKVAAAQHMNRVRVPQTIEQLTEMSRRTRGVVAEKLGKPIIVNGVTYPYLKAAEKALGIHPTTIRYRVNSPNFPEYQYA